MYAESLGSFALITSLILEYREDEGPLKLPNRFRASHAGPIHLQDDTLEFFLHGDFFQTELNACEVERHHHGKNLGGQLSEEDSGTEKAVTLVML